MQLESKQDDPVQVFFVLFCGFKYSEQNAKESILSVNVLSIQIILL